MYPENSVLITFFQKKKQLHPMGPFASCLGLVSDFFKNTYCHLGFSRCPDPCPPHMDTPLLWFTYHRQSCGFGSPLVVLGRNPFAVKHLLYIFKQVVPILQLVNMPILSIT